MAIINYTDQLKFAGKGYLDAKMMPVNTVEDLYKVPRTQRFEGLTITVLNNGAPLDYWLVGGTSDSNWVVKTVDNEKIENQINDEEKARIESDAQINASVSSLSGKVSTVANQTQSNSATLTTHTSEIKTLTERINILNGLVDSFNPDQETIGIKDGNEKTLYVKILSKEGNILTQEVNEKNESGLYATIPVFCEDEELM
jgi:hypothetical protein